jgi:flagellar hook protein FlgE
MSLFGAMNAGVSGLASQSSAMAAISDNITNVNTTGYKRTKVDFQTLVTKQAANSMYSSGGVQSRPRSGVDVQGLLQSSSSSTDLAISGAGFFLVNEAAKPGASDQFLFTRAGSFYTDNLGYLKNTGGFYLQAWPTDRKGTIILPSDQEGLTNQNIISTEFLETVNLNRVGGTADETTNISIGANLPAKDSVGGSHDVDVQFFDTLGNTNAVAFRFSKSATNQWDLTVEPPADTAAVTLYDGSATPRVYRSIGQIEFTSMPTAGPPADAVVVNGTTYTYGTANWPVGANLPAVVNNLLTQILANDAAFDPLVAGANTATLKAGTTTTILLTGGTHAAGADFTVDASACSATRQSLLQNPVYTVFRQGAPPAPATTMSPAITFNSDGLPSGFGVANMSIGGFVSGAASMDGSVVNVSRIGLDFGSVDEADGITQLSAEFTPNFIEQDGARFGVFSGITIGPDGLISALFDNGERRPIYRIPLVTFVNPDGLEAKSGNVWNATEASGNPTLRTADSGPAGQIIQSSLEASTVDIGEEFTNMIVVQRAYSAATRIISTADEMLEELVRIKR